MQLHCHVARAARDGCPIPTRRLSLGSERPWAVVVLLSVAFVPLPQSVSRGDQAAEKLILATYKLANDASTGTGTVFRSEAAEGASKSRLLTAHHVLDRMQGDSCTLVSRRRHENGVFQRHEIRLLIRREGKPLWKKHPAHDLAVLPLPDAMKVEALPLDSLASETLLADVHAGDAVQLAVFPERVEANNAGFPILRAGIIASYPVVPVKPHPVLLVDVTTWPGDSGGPVIHASLRSPSGGPLVVGVVRGMRNITETIKESRFVERRIHHPLGISEVLHATMARAMLSEP
jgi:hypothetical protein